MLQTYLLRGRKIMAKDITIGTRLGEISPDWVLPLLDGGELALNSLRGKKTLLFFWGSW
jgi:hypothetical protein